MTKLRQIRLRLGLQFPPYHEWSNWPSMGRTTPACSYQVQELLYFFMVNKGDSQLPKLAQGPLQEKTGVLFVP